MGIPVKALLAVHTASMFDSHPLRVVLLDLLWRSTWEISISNSHCGTITKSACAVADIENDGLGFEEGLGLIVEQLLAVGHAVGLFPEMLLLDWIATGMRTKRKRIASIPEKVDYPAPGVPVKSRCDRSHFWKRGKINLNSGGMVYCFAR
jgi:hypothetical protein